MYFDAEDEACYEHPIFDVLNFWVDTPISKNLFQKLDTGMINGSNGCLVTGQSQSGKSRAVRDCCERLSTRAGAKVAGRFGSMGNVNNSSRKMVVQILGREFVPSKGRISADALNSAICEHLVEESMRLKSQRCVLVVDELQELTLDQTHQVAYLFNALVERDLFPYVICVANSPEVEDLLAHINDKQNARLYERFFKTRIIYRGLNSAHEVEQTLKQYDTVRYSKGGPTITEYFLGSHHPDFKLANVADAMWSVFKEYRDLYGLESWGMKAFSAAVLILLADIFRAQGVSGDYYDAAKAAIDESNLVPSTLVL